MTTLPSPPTPKQYRIITRDSIVEFNRTISEGVCEGWRPDGELQMCYDPTNYRMVYAQRMVK